MGAQADLLRVLQERVLERVGSSEEIPVNVRIIAATNRNLAEMAEKRRFRSDLLYRLSVFPIYIPALRERPEDIPVLLNFFVLQQAKRRGFVIPPRIQPSEMRRLCGYGWPGNIREMQNAVIRAMLLWNGAKESAFTIDVGRRLFAGMFTAAQAQAAPQQAEQADGIPSISGSLRLEDAEREHIRRVLDMTGGRVTGKGGAAELMDINPSTLRARMKKLGVAR
jgi:transcriptional regulator with GAF, ATPase, and Fis domain